MLDLNNEDFNREYDEVCKDFEERLYNERLEEWLEYHDDSEDFPGVDMNALPLDDLCRLLKELMWVASQYETNGEEKRIMEEVTYCSECRYAYRNKNGERNPDDIICTYWYSDGLTQYDYCSKGEAGEYAWDEDSIEDANDWDTSFLRNIGFNFFGSLVVSQDAVKKLFDGNIRDMEVIGGLTNSSICHGFNDVVVIDLKELVRMYVYTRANKKEVIQVLRYLIDHGVVYERPGAGPIRYSEPWHGAYIASAFYEQERYKIWGLR